MLSLTSLWLPVVLSAVFVFVLSSVIHMFLTYHQGDVAQVPQEEAVRTALRGLAVPPGNYTMPFAGSTAAMRSPEYKQKLDEGPVAHLTVLPNGPYPMGRSLAQWFGYALIVGIFAGYIASHALGPGADYLAVFRFVGATAFMGYSLALLQDSIWWARKWSTTLKSMFDGLLYALVTAGTFGWLWPS